MHKSHICIAQILNNSNAFLGNYANGTQVTVKYVLLVQSSKAKIRVNYF